MGGMERCAQLCTECAEVCEQHSGRLSVGDHSEATSCIAACEACATECGEGAHHMDVCARCAEACRMCAETCRTAEASKA